MTRGEADTDEAPPASSRRAVRELSARETPAPLAQANQANNNDASANNTKDMPPPRTRTIRPLMGTPAAAGSNSGQSAAAEVQRPSASIDFDTLFVPADDDRQWDEPNEEETAEDTLGWDATTDQVCFQNLVLLQRAGETDKSEIKGDV